MAVSLKGQNIAGLYALMAANLALFYGALQHDAILAGNWAETASQFGQAVPAGLGLALTGVLNAQLSPEAKARIVFLRWRDPLPGCEAFTKHAKGDPRVDLAALRATCGPLPVTAREQNALWYRLYKSVGSEPAVTQVHRAFLFTRDYACLALFAFVVLGVAGLVQIPSLRTALLYLALPNIAALEEIALRQRALSAGAGRGTSRQPHILQDGIPRCGRGFSIRGLVWTCEVRDGHAAGPGCGDGTWHARRCVPDRHRRCHVCR